MKLTIVLVDNRGYKSIGELSRSLGMDGFGTLYRYRERPLGVDSDGARPTTYPSTSRRTRSRSARRSFARATIERAARGARGRAKRDAAGRDRGRGRPL